MFKKRIRVAGVVFVAILVLTLLCIVWWKVSEKTSMGTGTLKVLTGSTDMAEGVKISLGVAERVWNTEGAYADRETAVRKADHFYQTRTAQIAEQAVETGLHYEKQEVSEQRNRMIFQKLSPEFSQRGVQGKHWVKGNEFSCDLEWYLSEGHFYESETKYRIEDYVTLAEEEAFLYYYDGLGPKYYEADSLALILVEENPYYASRLCELDGAMYAYVEDELPQKFVCRYSYAEQAGAESAGNTATSSALMTRELWDFEITCERIDNRDFAEELSAFGEPELRLTARKGIYRFAEDGTAECVIEAGEYGDVWPYWLVANEEEHTLTLIGKKEKRLLAYNCCLETGEVEEVVLWDATDASEEFEDWWYETVSGYELADMVTEEGRSYLCRTSTFGRGSQVNLSIFEDGNRVFEGEVLQPESDFEGVDFSLTANETDWFASIVDKVEIQLIK